MVEVSGERDVLVVAKTVAANDFPVERPAVVGVDRETGGLLRLAPFPWKGADTDPPVQRWSWIQVRVARDERDVRAETVTVDDVIAATGYVDAKDGWRLRWPFVRAHLYGSLESLAELARGRATTVGFVAVAELDVLQLPLRMRFRCANEDCAATHELPVLDQELHAMAVLTRERYGAAWATKFRESWGRPRARRRAPAPTPSRSDRRRSASPSRGQSRACPTGGRRSCGPRALRRPPRRAARGAGPGARAGRPPANRSASSPICRRRR